MSEEELFESTFPGYKALIHDRHESTKTGKYQKKPSNMFSVWLHCRAELAALKAGQGEAVAYRWAWKECREDDGWTYRESPPFDPTTVVVQALYLATPASADAVSVPRELLERHLKNMACHPGMLFTPIEGLLGTFDELSALIAQSQEVKP